MDEQRTQTLDELKLRGDAALLDTRHMIDEILTIAQQTRRITERERPFPGFRTAPVAKNAK
jgi:hypothetical protein